MRITLEKRTISYLSVAARIRVIDTFTQMKREYNSILDNVDSANRNNFVPSQSFTWSSLGNFSHGHQYLKVNFQTAPKPALGAHWFKITVAGIKERSVGRDQKKIIGKEGGRGGGCKIVILSTCASTQIPNHKTRKKKQDISKQHSKQVIRQGKLRKTTKCLLIRFSWLQVDISLNKLSNISVWKQTFFRG